MQSPLQTTGKISSEEQAAVVNAQITWLNRRLVVAAANGDTETVKVLLKSSVIDPKSGLSIALCAAAMNGNTEIFRILLKDPRVPKSHGAA